MLLNFTHRAVEHDGGTYMIVSHTTNRQGYIQHLYSIYRSSPTSFEFYQSRKESWQENLE
jgi:hypothetical protein